MATKTGKVKARTTKVKGSNSNTNPFSSKKRGTKKSGIKKAKSSASSATRGLHGGRRKSV